jgi:hypothetical protein
MNKNITKTPQIIRQNDDSANPRPSPWTDDDYFNYFYPDYEDRLEETIAAVSNQLDDPRAFHWLLRLVAYMANFKPDRLANGMERLGIIVVPEGLKRVA